MQQPQQTIELKGITVDELNAILEAVGSLPFNRVAALIPKLVSQAQAQLNPAPPAPPEPPADGKSLDGGKDEDGAQTPETPPVH